MTDPDDEGGDLRELARAKSHGSPRDARLERATLEMAIGGRRELVMVTVRQGELRVVASDGSTEGPFIEAALALLAGTPAAGRTSEAPSSPGTERPPPRAVHPLADALEELLIAVVRSGIEAAPSSPAVREALDQVLREAPRPTPAGLGRALARLRRGLGDGDVDLVARVLDGGARLARDLREEALTPEATRRVRAWIEQAGTRANGQPLNERVLVEVGREWLGSAGSGSIQRRYLVCTTTGEVYREQRLEGEEASVGPCPRTLRVGLAQVEEGPSPRRIRLLQYEVAPDLVERSHDRLFEMAEREVSRVLERYRQGVRQYPALAEPVAILRAEGRLREDSSGFSLEDDEGAAIALRATAGAADFLRRLDAPATARWVAGRLAESEGKVVLDPISLGLMDPSGPRVVRL